MTIILDGKAVARECEEELKIRVENLKSQLGYIPVLATILVGDNHCQGLQLCITRS